MKLNCQQELFLHSRWRRQRKHCVENVYRGRNECEHTWRRCVNYHSNHNSYAKKWLNIWTQGIYLRTLNLLDSIIINLRFIFLVSRSPRLAFLPIHHSWRTNWLERESITCQSFMQTLTHSLKSSHALMVNTCIFFNDVPPHIWIVFTQYTRPPPSIDRNELNGSLTTEQSLEDLCWWMGMS